MIRCIACGVSYPENAGHLCSCGTEYDKEPLRFSELKATFGSVPQKIRQFETGATRDTDQGKYDYEGFFSPLVERSYAAFMHRHRTQTDGQLRDSDNWQKGIPKSAYIKSMFRHFIDAWSIHRGLQVSDNNGPVTMEDALNGIKFNVNGYIHELLKSQAEGLVVVNTDRLSDSSEVPHA
jgi:hypothetical protein